MRALLLLLVVCCSACVTAPPRPAPQPWVEAGLRVQQVAADAWVLTHEEVFASNVLAVRFPDGTVVFCSSPFDTVTTRAVIAWAKATLQPRRMVALNTHWHMDGSGGNQAWKEAGVETWASTQTFALNRERGPASRATSANGLEPRQAAQVLATPVVDAAHTFDPAQGLTLEFGGASLRVVYPGPAHSQDNVVVYFPAQRLLFGGCAVKVGDSLGYLGDASVATWEAALEVMRRFSADIVVPGHGEVGGPALIENTSRLVKAALAR